MLKKIIPLEKKNNKCSICLSPLHSSKKKIVCLDKCLHTYHSECITKWLENHDTCPYCRSKQQKPIKKSLTNRRRTRRHARNYRSQYIVRTNNIISEHHNPVLRRDINTENNRRDEQSNSVLRRGIITQINRRSLYRDFLKLFSDCFR